MKTTRALALASLILPAVIAFSPCGAAELITNGGFETGDFSGWTEVNQPGSAGDFYIDTPGTTTPYPSGHSTSANPSGGSFYAVTDEGGPSTNVLSQSFTISSVPSSVIVSFQMFVNNYGPTYTNSLDNTTANQYGRVDILTGSASPFDTTTGVLETLYSGSDAGANPHAFTSYSFDITSLVSTPGTYQLRFADSDNQDYINMGVDNVSILADFGPLVPVPEPSTMLVGGLCLGCMAFRMGRLYTSRATQLSRLA